MDAVDTGAADETEATFTSSPFKQQLLKFLWETQMDDLLQNRVSMQVLLFILTVPLALPTKFSPKLHYPLRHVRSF